MSAYSSSLINDLLKIHHMYFKSADMGSRKLLHRHWHVSELMFKQAYMIEETIANGNNDPNQHLFTLKVFSHDLYTIITIGQYERELDAMHIMQWLRVNNYSIDTIKDMVPIRAQLEDIFARSLI